MPNVSEVMGSSLDLTAMNMGVVSLATLLSALLTLVVCLIAIRIITTLLRRVLDKSPLDARLKKYAVSAVRFVLWVIAILIVADKLGIPVTSLVALLSVLSLAVSLAVQSVLSNIAGGLVILMTKPFKVGDFVECADGTGTVTDMRLPYTLLDTPDGLRISVPNSALSAGKIINYTTLGQRRIEHKITASYDTATETVRKACLEAAARTPGALTTPAPAVFVSAYGESSVEYAVHCWCKTEEYWPVYFGLLEEIRTAFAENGAEMTYNHLNVHIVDKAEKE